VAGSIAQSLLAAVVVLAFVAAGRDPVVDLFTWLSGVAAVGVVLLMTATSAAVIGFFRGRPGPENAWQRVVAPGLATVLLGAVLVVVVVNFNALLAPDSPGHLRWLLPGLVGLAAVIGLIWGFALRGSRPDVYAGIGRAVEPATEQGEAEYVAIPR
jgi:amino acid transporter